MKYSSQNIGLLLEQKNYIDLTGVQRIQKNMMTDRSFQFHWILRYLENWPCTLGVAMRLFPKGMGKLRGKIHHECGQRILWAMSPFTLGEQHVLCCSHQPW